MNDFPAVIWICQNQRGRRNITDKQKTYLLGKEYEASRKKRGRPEKVNNGPLSEKGKTGEILSKQYGVGYGTVIHSEKFAKGVDAIAEVSPIAKQKILSGDSGMSKTGMNDFPVRDKVAAVIYHLLLSCYHKG